MLALTPVGFLAKAPETAREGPHVAEAIAASCLRSPMFSRWGNMKEHSAAPVLFFEENLGEAEAAAGEFAGIVVANESDAFLADFG